MAHGMIADEMTLLRHAANKSGISSYQIVQHKESTGRIMLFERIEHALDIAVFVSRIKCEIYHLFLGIFAEKSRIVFLDKAHICLCLRALMILFSHAVPAVSRGKHTVCKKYGGKKA